MEIIVLLILTLATTVQCNPINNDFTTPNGDVDILFNKVYESIMPSDLWRNLVKNIYICINNTLNGTISQDVMDQASVYYQDFVTNFLSGVRTAIENQIDEDRLYGIKTTTTVMFDDGEPPRKLNEIESPEEFYYELKKRMLKDVPQIKITTANDMMDRLNDLFTETIKKIRELVKGRETATPEPLPVKTHTE